MITQTTNIYELVEKLPPGGVLTLDDVSWEEYEELLEAVGEQAVIRMTYDEGVLQVMTTSPRHGRFAATIQDLVRTLSLRLRVKVLILHPATMKKPKRKGTEPDLLVYVQSADLVEHLEEIDFNQDPPPDVVVEVDIHHGSISKFPIYVAFGVREVWRYQRQKLTIYHLREGEYIEADRSLALPLLTSQTLTDFIARSQAEGQYAALLAFEQWLPTQPSALS